MAKQPKFQGVQLQPGTDARHALRMPVLSGSNQFRELVAAYGGVDAVAREFKMTVRLVESYITGQSDPPYTVLLALYWHTHFGFSQAFADSHWTHQYNCFKRREAEEKVAYLEKVLEHAVALLEHRKGAPDLLRQALGSGALLADPF